MPLTVSAAFTYTDIYTSTGQNFTRGDVHVAAVKIEFMPEEILAFERDSKAGLLTSSLTMSVTLPVFLPAGWSSFTNHAILPWA